MVGSLVHRASQVNHPALGRLGYGVGRLAAPETMGKGGGSLLPVKRQYAPRMSRAYSHKCRGLFQRHLLRQQAVENLKSRLFFGLQCHILHEASVTFLLAC